MAEVSNAPFSRNTTGRPRPARYALGRGRASISFLDDDDNEDGDGWEHLGNMPQLTASLSQQFLDHFSSLAGLRDRDARIVIESLFDMKGQLEELNERTAALFLQSTPAEYVNPTIAGFAEREMVAAAKLGRYYPIVNGDGDQAFGVAAADVTVKQKATQVLAAAGRTLTFATADDTITASTGSFITDGYRVGQTLVVAGTASNNGNKTITDVTALVITVAENLTDEGPLNATATLNATLLLVEGTDYEVEEAEGEIFLLSTSTDIVEDDTLAVTLAANAAADSMRKIEVQSAGEITAAFKFYGVNPRDGRKYLLHVFKATIAGDGDLGLITGQELVNVPITISAVKKDANTPIAVLYPLPTGGVT